MWATLICFFSIYAIVTACMIINTCGMIAYMFSDICSELFYRNTVEQRYNLRQKFSQVLPWRRPKENEVQPWRFAGTTLTTLSITALSLVLSCFGNKTLITEWVRLACVFVCVSVFVWLKKANVNVLILLCMYYNTYRHSLNQSSIEAEEESILLSRKLCIVIRFLPEIMCAELTEFVWR